MALPTKQLSHNDLHDFLEAKVEQFNQIGFIENDPICIPHRFSNPRDIEIMGFWAAMLAWGQRVTIINKCIELIDLMDGQPYDFITNHQDSDLKRFLSFKHRTFNSTDTLYFIAFLKAHYDKHTSLESAFISTQKNTESHLAHFHDYFFSLEDAPQRTRKHIATPIRKSTCKRLNMFLRWMIRKDDKGVDFGIWNALSPADLICPLDVHVDRVARHLRLIDRKQTDWKTALELTERLKTFDPSDPVKYDFALFGLGIESKELS